MGKTKELRDKAYRIATAECYNASTKTNAMIAYALLAIAEKLATPNDKEAK